MKHTPLMILIIICLTSLIGCASDPLIGKWRVTKAQNNPPPGQTTFEFLSDKRFVMQDSDRGTVDGIYVTDDSKSPERITLKIEHPKPDTIPGIYKLEGDSLILKVINDGGIPTPTDFNVEPRYVLFTLERGGNSQSVGTQPKQSSNGSNARVVDNANTGKGITNPPNNH